MDKIGYIRLLFRQNRVQEDHGHRSLMHEAQNHSKRDSDAWATRPRPRQSTRIHFVELFRARLLPRTAPRRAQHQQNIHFPPKTRWNSCSHLHAPDFDLRTRSNLRKGGNKKKPISEHFSSRSQVVRTHNWTTRPAFGTTSERMCMNSYHCLLSVNFAA